MGVAVGLLLGAAADDASATALGGAAASFGVLAALSAILLLRAWQAHVVAGGLSALCGMLALAVGGVLLWRSRSMLGAGGMADLAPALVEGDNVATTGARLVPLPPGIDRSGLLGDLRRQFVELQSAWDSNSREQLLGMTTPDMLEELCAARSVGLGAGHCTEVMTLNAHMVAFEEVDATQMVCVEFSGMIRESAGLDATPFRELWLLTRARQGAGSWRLARHQALL